MKVVFREGALADLDRIYDWIAKDRPQSALAVVGRILDSSEQLGRFPNLGHSGRAPHALEWVVPRLPYVVIYRINEADKVIDVIAIMHSAQDRERGR